MSSSLLFLTAELLAAPVRTSEEVRQVIGEVLSDPEYQKQLASVEVEEGFFRAVLGLLGRVLEWLKGLGGALADLSVSQPALFWIIMLAMVLVLILLLWHIAYSISLAFRVTPRAPPARASQGEAPLQYRRLWRRAEELAAAGDYTEAIRHLLLALLARMEAGKVSILPGWTNREIVARLRLDEARRGSLSSFVSTADRLWYGLRPADEDDYRRSRTIAATFLRDPEPGGEADA